MKWETGTTPFLRVLDKKNEIPIEELFSDVLSERQDENIFKKKENKIQQRKEKVVVTWQL